MTTAPTPSDAERLAELIERGPQRQGDALIATTLRRLQAENERLRADIMEHYEKQLRDWRAR